MIDQPWLAYLLGFVTAGLIATVLTPVAIKAAVQLGVLDQPGGHKSHHLPTPYLGGLAMVVGFTVTVAVATVVWPPVSGVGELAAILGVALALATVGLLDDLRGLGVAPRILAQLAAAGALWAAGIRVDLLGVGVLDVVVTIVWIVGITNAMNLLDNMDGLSAGIATIAALWFGLIAALNAQILVAPLAFALAGCALGFLRQNRPPARIYMGDAGSLFLGVVLAAIGVKLAFPPLPPLSAAMIPILVLTVPVMDTALVMIDRIRHGRSPFQGGQDHLSHRLVRLGLPVPVAVSTIAVLGVAHGWMALIVSRVDLATALLVAGLIVLVDLLLFLLVLQVPVYPNSRGRDLVMRDRAVDEREPPR